MKNDEVMPEIDGKEFKDFYELMHALSSGVLPVRVKFENSGYIIRTKDQVRTLLVGALMRDDMRVGI